MNCEKDEFGRTLQHGFHTDGDDCQLCERDGQIALPRYVPETVIENNVVTSTTVLEEGNAPRLCDEHFHMIVEGVDVEPVLRP